MTDEVKQWIRDAYGKDFVAEGKGVHESSVKALNPHEEKCDSQIREYLVDRLKEIEIEEKSINNNK